ncbi:MAG: hypothetical protein U0930_15275 [Pirellulales bacterium]
MTQREKLKEEIEQLATSGRRWNELAALRASQAQELEELKQRIEQAVEARTFGGCSRKFVRHGLNEPT